MIFPGMPTPLSQVEQYAVMSWFCEEEEGGLKWVDEGWWIVDEGWICG